MFPFLQRLISKRENHLLEYEEFNKIEEQRFTFEELVNWVKIVSEEKYKSGEKFRILEVGTKRSKEDVPTHSKSFFENIVNIEHILTDYQEGLDVDIVCDLHKTSGIFEDKSFDLIINVSLLEHIKYPQLCCHNLMKMLKNGGRIYILTHQTFPLHGYKYDYFRFSREAIKGIFNKNMNMKTVTSYYRYNCAIIPHTPYPNWNDVAESYLEVVYIGEKINETPDEYIYDIEST